MDSLHFRRRPEKIDPARTWIRPIFIEAPMTEILDRPVDCAANWKGPEIARSTDWIPDRVNALISRVAYVAWRSGQLNTRFHRRKTAWPRYPQIYTSTVAGPSSPRRISVLNT